MNHNKKINWAVALFITLTPLVGITGTILLSIFSHVSAWTWVLFFVMWAATGISITAGYHRLFSHRSYKASWVVKLFFICFGAATFEGSVLEWSCDHRYHHRHTDTDNDPYSIKKGFWHAHMGWLFYIDDAQRDYSNVDDLSADPLVRWANQYYLVLAIFFGFVFPTLLAWCWGDPWGGLIVAGTLRIVVGHHATWAINSICHMFGKKNYIEQSAVDNPITALFTWGEGFHNYHHQFPLDYRNGIRWFDYDPTKWLIYLLSRCRLAWGLKTMTRSQVLKYRIRYQMQQVQASVSQKAQSLLKGTEEVYQKLYEQLQLRLKKIDVIEKKIMALKKEQYGHMIKSEYRRRIRLQKIKLAYQWSHLKLTLKLWRSVVKLA